MDSAHGTVDSVRSPGSNPRPPLCEPKGCFIRAVVALHCYTSQMVDRGAQQILCIEINLTSTLWFLPAGGNVIICSRLTAAMIIFALPPTMGLILRQVLRLLAFGEISIQNLQSVCRWGRRLYLVR